MTARARLAKHANAFNCQHECSTSCRESIIFNPDVSCISQAELVAKQTEVHNLSRHLPGCQTKVATLENKVAIFGQELKKLSGYRKKLAALSQELEGLSERF